MDNQLTPTTQPLSSLQEQPSSELVNSVQSQGYEELVPTPITPTGQPSVIQEVVGETPEAVPTQETAVETELEKALRAQVEAAPAPEAPNFDAPEMTQFNEQFKQYMGVDLKEAFDTFASMKTELQQMKQQSMQSEATKVKDQLRAAWGVNEQEIARRAEVIQGFASQLPPNLQAELNTVEGIQLAWRVVSQDNTSVSSRAITPVTTDKKIFSQVELQNMIINNPAEYAARESEIQLAYLEGRVR
jgi:hypothetical protein